ncbi:MAG TPA: hypothetical protein VFD37_03360, partial [Solirubrobacterales bacterium]|nr:hypothetical protein [Solirubrobacterales bacterium]
SEPAPAPPAAEAAPPPTAAPPPAADALSLEEVTRLWPAVLDALRADGQDLLAALVEGTRPASLDHEAGELVIGFPAGGAFSKRKAEESDRRAAIAAAIETTLGERLRPAFTLLDGEPEATEESLDDEELLRQLKTKFNAEEVS